MQYHNLFDIIRVALPDDVDPDSLYAAYPVTEWQEDPFKTAYRVLKESPRINWEAYLEDNPAIRETETDPCLHFLESGMYEGKKLFSTHPLQNSTEANRPLISIIIAVYNNELFLHKGMESLLCQSLQDIEIIAVDDASTDGSIEILRSYAALDSRLKILQNEINSGIFLTRKKGVLASRGKYLKFMDGDDFLTPDACEISYREISRGYDIVEAGTKIINIAGVDNEIIQLSHNYFNNNKKQEYVGNEILKGYYDENTLAWCLWNKTFVREICVAAYKELPEGYFVGTEDAYAFAAIGRRARKLRKIATPLYCYHYGSGVTTKKNSNAKNALWFKNGDALAALEKYISGYNLPVNFEKVKKNQCAHSLRQWLNAVPPEETHYFYNILKQQYGLPITLQTLCERFPEQFLAIAKKFKSCTEALPAVRQPVAHIGVLAAPVYTFTYLYFLRQLAALLANRNIKVTFFIDRSMIAQLRQYPQSRSFDIIPITFGNSKDQLDDLRFAVESKPIDVMVYTGDITQNTLWSMILLDGYEIPIIIDYRGNFATPFYGLKHGFLPYHSTQAILEAASAVICHSRSTELFLRMHGINACSLPYPLEIAPETRASALSDKNVVIFADPGDANAQLEESLKILKEAKKYYPALGVSIVGLYTSQESRESLRRLAASHNLENNIALISEIADLGQFLVQFDLLLSTAFNSSLNIPLPLANALGIPCLIYPVPEVEEMAHIVPVPPGNIQRAAEEVVRILMESKRRPVLPTPSAWGLMRPVFIDSFLELLNNFQHTSPLNKYGPRDFRQIIRAAAQYTCTKV